MGLTSEQLAECKEAFSLFDTDGDNFISTRDVGTVMRSVGCSPTEAEVGDIVSRVDKSGSGQVSYNDFEKLLGEFLAKDQGDPEEELLEAFKVFDKDGNGRISAVELRHVVTSLGEKLSEPEVTELLHEADIDSDGMLDYRAFTRVLLK